jgi:hypothetical protein
MAHSYIYGIHMNINLRCCRCLQPLDATVLRPRSHEHGDVIVHVEPCEKCMKEIVVTDAMIEARRTDLETKPVLH